MSAKDLLRLITEKTFVRLNSPKTERMNDKEESKNFRKQISRPEYWLGTLPFMVKCALKKKKSDSSKTG